MIKVYCKDESKAIFDEGERWDVRGNVLFILPKQGAGTLPIAVFASGFWQFVEDNKEDVQ